MSRKGPATLLGGAAVLTVAILLVISLFLHRAPDSTGTLPVDAPSPRSSAAASVRASLPASPAASSLAPVPDGEADPSGPSSDARDADGDDASPGDVPYSQTPEARRQWEPVVVGFGSSFTRTDDRSATGWRAGLDRYVTTEVQHQLRTVDPRNVPAGSYAGFEVDTYDEEAVTVKVTYSGGWALILYLICDGETWRIYRYDRWDE